MRAQHRDMIGGGFGIRRAHANIHQCDAIAICAGQVIGRHLRHFLRRLQRGICGCDAMIVRSNKGQIATVWIFHLLTGEGLKFLHIELVVGKQYMVLEKFRICGGVMAQTGQGIIHPLRIK